MKLILRSLVTSVAVALLPVVFGQAPAPAEPPRPHVELKKEIRIHHGDHPGMEMETATFLGVEAGPVSPTLIAQLNLPDHAGLVVLHVVPDSAAAGALKEHDILLKLDDQILIDEHQLAVLVRNHKDGDQVTLTYVRGGKSATASVKLTKHEVPKFSETMHPMPRMLTLPEHGQMIAGAVGGNGREEMDRMLSLMDRAHGGEPVRMRFEHIDGPGMRAVSVNTANSNLVYSDEKGALELTFKDGKKTLVAKDPKGVQQFSGPVTTDDERKAMPADVRERLEKLEAMHDVTFRTDENFEGAETKVFEPQAKPIVLPYNAAASNTPMHRSF
jgi:serine protease Do